MNPTSSRRRQIFPQGLCIALVALTAGGLPAGSAAGAQPLPAADLESVVSGRYPAPPRNIEDINALLDSYQPDPARIARATEAANLEPPAGADKAALARFYFERSRARGELGMMSSHIADLRIAAEHAKGMTSGLGGQPDSNIEGRVLFELSIMERGGGNYVNALRLSEQLLSVTRSTARPNPAFLIAAYQGVASINAALGDLATAKESLALAERSLSSMSSWDVAYRRRFGATVERTRGDVALAEGKYAAAAQAYGKAVALMDENQEAYLGLIKKRGGELGTPGQFHFFRNLQEQDRADALVQLGRLADAEAAYRDVLMRNLRLFGRFSTASASTVGRLARVVSEQGRYREAESLSRIAVDTLEKTGVVPESIRLAETRKIYGATLVAQGKYREALPVYEAMQEGLARDPLLLQKFGTGDLNWGYALTMTGEAAKAAAMLQQLFDTARARLGDQDYSVAELRGYLAIALAASGDRAGASREFAMAVPVLLQLARQEQGGEESSGIARALRLTRILEAYIALLTQGSPGQEAVAESFRLADVARGSQVQRALSSSATRASIRDPQLAELARREQDGQHRLGVLTDLVNRLASAPRDQQLPKVVADMRAAIVALRSERAQLRTEIERRFPDYANLIDPKPTTVREAQAALQAGETLISIYVGADQTYVWAVPRQGEPVLAMAPLGEAQFIDIVGRLRRALDSGATGLAQIPSFDLARGQQVYDALLKPVEPAWKDAQSLLIVPHGALGQLPFALLPTGAAAEAGGTSVMFAQYKAVPWLVRRVAITQLPSVNTLVTLRKLPPGDAARRAFAGFGDPYFSKEQQAQAARESRVQLASADLGLRNLAIARVEATASSMDGLPASEAGAPPSVVGKHVANSSTLAQLARLPDTADEIREIAQALKADPAQDVFLGQTASERTVKRMDLSNRRVIAFATHGLVPGDLDGLTQPALALSAPAVADGDGDGLLSMDEILALKLNADWVVLSACNTAAGDGAGSEAVSGLGRAFFYAGARALLVSNWPVESVSARLLTTELFRRQMQDPNLTRAQALRQAMLALIDGPGASDNSGKMRYSYAHPMFWAPFSLVGDGAK